MRLFATLFALLFAATASGQDAEPDTTDPASYVPLEVGNRWEYTPDRNDIGPYVRHFRTMIVADTTINGERWFVRREQTFLKEGRALVLETDRREAVRFDGGAGTVVRWTGTEAVLDFPCRLDGPLGEHADACADGPYVSYGKGPDTVDVAGRSVESVVIRFDGAVPGPTFVAGVGDIGQGFEGRGGRYLAFASVGGETYGEPVEGLPNLPDPTPPWMYYPLHVGDQSVFFEESVIAHGYTRRTVKRDTTIEGRTYFIIEWDWYDLRSASPAWTPRRREVLRYDSTTTNVVQRNEAGTVAESVVVCRLGADINTEVDCGDGRTYSYFGGGLNQTVRIGGQTYEVPSIKYPGPFAITPQPPGYAAGIGRLEFNAPANANSRYEYARVSGVEYGTYPVSSGTRPDPTRLGVRLSPNPTSGPVAVALTLPEAVDVTVEVFDALCRHVARTEAALPAGAQEIELDAGAWAPGLYVVRVTAGEATASGTVVRR